MPKVSVVIPSYNCAKYLPEAINSVLKQSFRNYEIIVVDDGSTDNTKEILNSFNGKIKYLFQQNSGHSIARNNAISKASGKYVAFLDADDIWLPNKLMEQIEFLDAAPDVGMVHSNIIFIDENGKHMNYPMRNNKFLSGKIFNYLLTRKAHISSPTVVIRKECLDKIGLFDENLTRLGSEDRDLWLRITKEYEVKYLDKPLAYYRIRKNSQSSNSEKMFLGRLYTLKKIFYKYDLSFWLKSLVFSKTYKDYGDELQINGNLGLSRKQYMKSILYFPFNLGAFINLLKSYFNIRNKNV